MNRFYGFTEIQAKTQSKEAFTLAEILITLAIIGVVAAISIPSVISNSQQQEFRTGLRKAVSVLNSAITMNMALDGETPYDNANLMGFLMKHMAVIESTTDVRTRYYVAGNTSSGSVANSVFYTTDGMKFELRNGQSNFNLKLHETNIAVCQKGVTGSHIVDSSKACGGCGSYGLNSNIDKTTKVPCLIMVDVNGDKKPNPANINCKDVSCAKAYKYSDIQGVKLTDLFSVMITDKSAVPYGVAAQRAMYQAQK